MRQVLLSSSLLLVALMSGCSSDDAPEIGNVAGTVTLDDAPLSSGAINFVSDDLGFAASADVQEDGSFELISQYGRGLPIGTYKVSISPATRDASGDPSNIQSAPSDSDSIPEKYGDPGTSGFTAEVQSGSNTFTFDMRSQPN